MHTALGHSVSVSVCHKSRSSIKKVERIGLVFGMRAVFNLPYSVLQGNSGTFKNKGTSL